MVLCAKTVPRNHANKNMLHKNNDFTPFSPSKDNPGLKELKNRKGKKNMDPLGKVTEAFVKESKELLGCNLVGVYLHGSAVMGCFNEKKSDIDLLVVVNGGISDEIKRRYMDMVVKRNAEAPGKGIEMSIVRKEV